MKITLPSYLPFFFTAFLVSSCAAVSSDDESAVISPSHVAKRIVKIETNAYAEIVSDTASLSAQYGTENVLVVLDIDNTILTSTTDLGSDLWYQWQRGKLDIKPTAAQQVACLFEDSIGLLYELAPMRLTEKNINQTISNWQTAGHTVVALTSRAPKYRAATERELTRNQVDLTASALVPVGQYSMLFREIKGREISYMQGVMMTSGLNKGEMLQHLLDKTQRTFSAIVFVDDSKKNIDNIYNAYQNTQNLDMHIYHYTRVEDEREKQFGHVLTQDQADNMAEQWQQLNRTLQHIFPARNLEQGCLDR
ncbi:DUF2608 domain-containing protein [uncultured Paraglaciecola sp.]|uniref:DUF2608 domain-containing protein n=1 Tax=uncultured Paraglaciecola sp. TaxID=1765024 RepID=UPI0026083882|nr:DUF2608 domain-containing protein [uncultured Paraglaciecola sp.]